MALPPAQKSWRRLTGKIKKAVGPLVAASRAIGAGVGPFHVVCHEMRTHHPPFIFFREGAGENRASAAAAQAYRIAVLLPSLRLICRRHSGPSFEVVQHRSNVEHLARAYRLAVLLFDGIAKRREGSSLLSSSCDIDEYMALMYVDPTLLLVSSILPFPCAFHGGGADCGYIYDIDDCGGLYLEEQVRGIDRSMDSRVLTPSLWRVFFFLHLWQSSRSASCGCWLLLRAFCLASGYMDKIDGRVVS